MEVPSRVLAHPRGVCCQPRSKTPPVGTSHRLSLLRPAIPGMYSYNLEEEADKEKPSTSSLQSQPLTEAGGL